MQTDVRSVRAPEESARAFVYRVLSTYIKEMFLHPGEKLAETDVAAELQVSRTPVHDTFSRLEREKGISGLCFQDLLQDVRDDRCRSGHQQLPEAYVSRYER